MQKCEHRLWCFYLIEVRGHLYHCNPGQAPATTMNQSAPAVLLVQVWVDPWMHTVPKNSVRIRHVFLPLCLPLGLICLHLPISPLSPHSTPSLTSTHHCPRLTYSTGPLQSSASIQPAGMWAGMWAPCVATKSFIALLWQPVLGGHAFHWPRPWMGLDRKYRS